MLFFYVVNYKNKEPSLEMNHPLCMYLKDGAVFTNQFGLIVCSGVVKICRSL